MVKAPPFKILVRFFALLLFLFQLFLPTRAVLAANAGDLDTSFSTDGLQMTDFSSGNDYGRAMAIQSDGKIIVAGYALVNGLNYDYGLARYNTDGSLDTTFSSDGKVTTDSELGDDVALSIAIQSDGKIIAAGYTNNGGNNDLSLARYNTDGSLDTSFDSDGMVITAIGSSHDYGRGVAIQSNGKIVVIGYAINGSGNSDFFVVRYNSNGSLDTSFDSDGIQTTAIGSGEDLAISVALQSDGKIVLGGTYHNGSVYKIAAARYTTSGALDTDFDSDGIITTSIGSGQDQAFSVVVQSDGKIVLGGTSTNGSGNYDFAVVRYNSNGSLDTSFDSDGIQTTAIGSAHDVGLFLLLQSDGKLVLDGESSNGSNYDFAVVRYNSNGSLDTDFGNGGKQTASFGSGDDIPWGAGIQSDGNIIGAGLAYNGSNSDFGVARFIGTDTPATPEFGSLVYMSTLFICGWFIFRHMSSTKGLVSNF